MNSASIAVCISNRTPRWATSASVAPMPALLLHPGSDVTPEPPTLPLVQMRQNDSELACKNILIDATAFLQSFEAFPLHFTDRPPRAHCRALVQRPLATRRSPPPIAG